MSQAHSQDKHHPDSHGQDSHGQSDAQDQPRNSDQPQALVQPNSFKFQVDIDAGNFSFFSKLPLKIQRNIWEIAAVPKPRVIEIETICERDAEGKIHLTDDDDDNIVEWSPTQCSPTPLLEICRESRSIAMKHYKYSSFLDRPLFYNTDLDTLWVRGNPLFRCFVVELGFETTLEVSSWHRCSPESVPYLFRSVALDFAGIKAHHKIFPWEGNVPQDPNLCELYAVSRTEVEEVYIVYSSGDCRDEVDQEVKYLVEQMKWITQQPYIIAWIQKMLKERNERDGTNLTKWKMPTVKAILDTRLLNPVETFHNFPNLPLELRRAIWKFAAIPHYRAIQIETKYEGVTVEYGRPLNVWRRQAASPCYPNGLFETCRESREIAITKHDHSKVHTISTPLKEGRNIPRRFYYNVDNDIMWMRGDPLRKTGSPEVEHGFLDKIPHEQFSNIAIDVETLMESNFPQDPAHSYPADFFNRTEFFFAMPFFQNLAVKKVYLVCSRVDQIGEAYEILEDLLDFINDHEQEKWEILNSRMIREGITGRLWTWPVLEVILESDLFENTKDGSGNIILASNCHDRRSYLIEN
ncbi:uncharacterized protein EAE98_007544 [Botrytis deweyae]|uniref:2EXR domain-containing protein n=1 Tax=Botrytis deweyae TaxID=2478750 RepID=A0ABQ7IGK9_9HELO|nr:uncharacterized protein EAE98_007544 [Botrytis deweyae]KAF7923726.1 hypothetical protein EAE98_007544 [Botrytis deweyae]